MEGNQDLYRRGKRIFDAAVELPAPERAGYLSRECAGDRRLREHIQRLLELDGDDHADPSPIASISALLRCESLEGERVGRYRILRSLGAGGMGTVYEAEQDQPRRSVALKLMRDALSSRQALRRFEFEVEVLARLRHPGIAQVYEAGTVEIAGCATPFFAMELVCDARSITEFAAERSLSLGECVELFARVCDAVQHGHQNGVIHRDLKPANLLIDASGQPKVIDFGIARSTGSDLTLTTLRTRAGELLGTLGYMSPEQCDADPGAIDTRTDVYSLGVVLYELLCGEPPYDLSGLTIAAATRVIREQLPRPPAAARRELRGDLEAILLKALCKERGRRYASAASLADDLRRHLAGQPLAARLPNLFERLVAAARRHPLAMTTAACAVAGVALLSSSWVGAWFFGRQPYRIVLGEDRSSVKLESRSGAELHRWELGSPGSVADAAIVDVAGDEPSRLVVIAATYSARWAEGGELCAFDLERPHLRLWSSADSPLLMPPDEPDRPEASFGCEKLLVQDVFELCPGDEIVVTQRLSLYSATAISVFDLTGRLRYRAWNDAPVTDLAWLSRVRRLVATSADTEVRWDTGAADSPEAHPMYPAVVFSLEPRLDRRGEDWIVRSGAVRDDTLRWYRWLGPSASLDGLTGLRCGLHHDLGRLDPTSHIGLWFVPDASPPELGASLNFVLDGDAREVRRWVSDDWAAAAGKGALPAPELLALLPYERLGR